MYLFESDRLKDQQRLLMAEQAAEIRQRMAEHAIAVAKLDEQIAAAEQEEQRDGEDPEVLVRRSVGAVRSVYHKRYGACGKTKQGGDFMTMRESEAKSRYHGALHRCPSCWKR
jgi:hypothetical protein